MFPRFSIVKQRTDVIDSVLLNLTWGTLEFGFTISRKPLEIDFEDELYPHQRSRNLTAIIFMVLVHLFVVYFLLFKKVDHPLKPGEEAGQLVFLELPGKKARPQPSKPPAEKKPQIQSNPHAITPPIISPPTSSPVAAPVYEDTMSQIAAARERRRAAESQAVQENTEAASTGPSENDQALARIKANIQAANYSRKGTNGIFQVLNVGVQNGRFAFRGWTNSPSESTHRTYEVDAGIGGDVRMAIIRRMIDLIREHYSGDFNWDSQRLGRVVVLSARPADSAGLEIFLMKEIFDTKNDSYH